MKNRKFFYILLSLIIIFATLTTDSSFFNIAPNNNQAYAEGTVIIYAPDGRQATVYESEAAAYYSLGWYPTYEDVTVTLYAGDGRTITVYKDEAGTYLNLGWYASKDDVTRTITKAGCGEQTVYLSELEAYINDGWTVPVKIDPTKPMVALTFDDGPSPYYTKRIVDTLVKYQARATFFSVGRNVLNYPDVTKYVHDKGMEVANHTYTHPELTRVSAATLNRELSNTSSEISLATGVAPTLMRPPYGSVNASVNQACPMPMILWSIDTEDWKSRNAASVFNRVAGKVKDGDIILMHDLYKSTADAVDSIVPYLVNNGFQIVSVSTLAEYKGYTLAPGQTYRSMR